MTRFLIRRILNAVLLLAITLTLTFVILRVAPGDPLARYYSPDIDPRAMETVRRQLGLDDPLPLQYVKTMASFVRGEFGVSLRQYRPVADMIAEAVPRTLALTVPALVLQLLLGLALGVYASRRRGAAERVLNTGALVLYSIPSFYMAFMFILLFALVLGWLPAAGMASLDAAELTTPARLLDRLAHMILPVSILALGGVAVMARFSRGRLLDVYSEEFIRTAVAKGADERSVVWRHALRNAAPQLLTVVALSVPQLITGSVVIEKVFAWPGMGALAVDSVFARDYPAVLATTFVGAVIVIVSNLLVDISYVVVDPRLRSQFKAGSK